MSEPYDRRVGVIDIGSNSVRLVIFSVFGNAIYPTFNEKVMAGLGKGLGRTGALSPGGRVLALAALARYRAILSGLGVSDLRAVATAAVRVAEDGRDFAREAEAVLGTGITVLSGLDEGRLSALGVESGFHRAQGVVADLGGSSLELFGLGERGEGETHMLGPLALLRDEVQRPKDVRAHVSKALASSRQVKAGIPRIFAVGGAWRAFAKVVIAREAYPLRVLHGFSIPADLVKSTTRHIMANQGTRELTDIAGRRAAQLHLTGTVLDQLTQISGAQDVVISSYGLREGVVAEHLGLDGHDGLLDGLVAFSDLSVHQRAFSDQLFEFTRPLFEANPPVMGDGAGEVRLHQAACYLSESAGKYHPDHRQDMAFEKVLYAPLSGVSHTQRVFLAASIGWRYSRRFSVPGPLEDFLSSRQVRRARQLGQAMRLGCVLSGRSASLLAMASLERRGDRLVLSLPRSRAAMVSESVERRLNQTADIFDLSPAISLV